MFRQGNLSQTQEDQVTTWTQGSYDRAAVIKAFRRLDKVHKEKGGRHFASYEGDSDGEFVEEDGDSEEYVYLGEVTSNRCTKRKRFRRLWPPISKSERPSKTRR